MPKPKKPTAETRPVAVYIRVSSKDQKTDSQRQCISEWLARNGYDLDQVDWYLEVESGRTMKRPAFDRLRADIFHGTVQTVVVFKIDRLARRLREGLDVLCDWCDRARELQAKGLRAPEIAQALGVSPRTVFRYLRAAES